MSKFPFFMLYLHMIGLMPLAKFLIKCWRSLQED